MSKLNSDPKDYRCEIDRTGRVLFYYNDKLIKGRAVPSGVLRTLECTGHLTTHKIMNLPSYFDLLPGDLRRLLLLYYLSRFDLLEVCRFSDVSKLKGSTTSTEGYFSLMKCPTDDAFWKNKLFVDFDRNLKEDIDEAETSSEKLRAEKEYGYDVEDITSQGTNSGWKNLYIIFTYAESFGEPINRDTISEFMDATNFLSVPELTDAYMNSSHRDVFIIHYVTRPKIISYIFNHYSQDKKYLALQLLLHHPSYLVSAITQYPELNVSLLELASTADQINLEYYVSRVGNGISKQLEHALSKI